MLQNNIHNLLKVMRRLYRILVNSKLQKSVCINNPDEVAEIIFNYLENGNPTMIARFGSTELMCMDNYSGILKGANYWKYIIGEQEIWWWAETTRNQMTQWSGFFPSTDNQLKRFCELMLESSRQVDVLGSWLANEKNYIDPVHVPFVWIIYLEPFWSEIPWTRALKGKKVLVIHPFAELIEKQYQKREYLFKNQDILPEFELSTIAAVQSLGGESNGFADWFEALQWMQSEIDKADFDICLLGCGAYGFPLASYIKNKGKQAIHIGGSLQLFFGIKGKRWTNPQKSIDTFGKPGMYESLFNEYWVFPSDENKPQNANQVEGACYW